MEVNKGFARETIFSAFFSLPSLASAFRVHSGTIRRWIREGRFPAADVKIGPRCHRWSRVLLASRFPAFADGSQKGEGVASCE